jgi:alpha-ketoglutarate-dependent taurine dioxygenase
VTYESIQVDEMSPACGAIIEGLDLSAELTNRQFDEIHSALLDRTVIVFRNQDLTQAQLSTFARRFGEVQPSSASGFEKSDEHPDVDILEYDSDNPPHVTKELWHHGFRRHPTARTGHSTLRQGYPARGRRYNLGQRHRGLRGAIGPHESPSRRALGL